MKTFSKYLINEDPIFFLPTIAKNIGLNEAILLQKINGWLQCKPHDADDRAWIYNTYKSWQEQLPFMSESTIKRALKKLEDEKIIVAGNFNKSKFDKTKWYTINYDKIDELCVNSDEVNLTYSREPNWHNQLGQNEQTYTNNNNNNKNNNIYIDQFEKFYELYPRKETRKKSEEWFIKHKPNEEQFKLMLEKLEIFKKSKQWQNKQYIPQPLTWLNQERWLDEIDEEKKDFGKIHLEID